MAPIEPLVRQSGMELPLDRRGILYRRVAAQHGITDNQLSRAVRLGQLVRLWPGAFVTAARFESIEADELHRLQTHAAVGLGAGTAIPSHQSAGLLHGMSLLMPDLTRVHVSTGLPGGGRIEARRHLHQGDLGAEHIAVVDGCRVTSLARTAADIACAAENFAKALAAMDSAIRLGADPVVIGEILDDRPRTGVATARRALASADPRAENAGESWGRAQMICAGLPVPRLQHEFFDAAGNFVARCDYDWDGRLVGELDGMAKYQRLLRPGVTPFEAMRREKLREDALRRLDVMVIRWVWRDLVDGRVVGMIGEWLDRLGIAA